MPITESRRGEEWFLEVMGALEEPEPVRVKAGPWNTGAPSREEGLEPWDDEEGLDGRAE